MMGHLPILKSVYLSDLENVKSNSSSFYGINSSSSNNVFPALETLDLRNMPNLMKWVDAEIPNGTEVKVLFGHLQEQLLVTEGKLKGSEYQLAPWRSDEAWLT